jgi:glycosyltransferase involved in cell wall biosynthesis
MVIDDVRDNAFRAPPAFRTLFFGDGARAEAYVMKAAVITGLYEPDAVGGAEVVAAANVREIRDRGDEVFVITSAPFRGLRSLRPAVEERDGVRIFRFFPLNILHYPRIFTQPFWVRAVWHALDMFNLHAFFTIRAVLRREKPDAALTHNVKGVGWLTWLAIRSLGIRCEHRMHDIIFLQPSGLLMAGDEARLDDNFHRVYQAVCRALVGSPARVVCGSRWLLEQLAARGFFPRSQREAAANPLPAIAGPSIPRRAGEPLRLLYAGQFEMHKGVVFLVNALKATTDPPFVLRLAGAGSQRETLARLIDGDRRFVLLGHLPHDELGQQFRESDCLIVPSLCHENAPSVIGMARAMGLRVVASRVGGIPEMAADAELFPAGDATALLQRLESVAKSEDGAE